MEDKKSNTGGSDSKEDRNLEKEESKRSSQQGVSTHDLSGDDKLQKKKEQKDRLSAGAPQAYERDAE
jgi:hypothetical protein